MATSDVKVWNGTAWVSLKGEPGPQAVSADAGNLTKLGTDSKVYTSVQASDVQGLGTIAVKDAGAYLTAGKNTSTASGILSATSFYTTLGVPARGIFEDRGVTLISDQVAASGVILDGKSLRMGYGNASPQGISIVCSVVAAEQKVGIDFPAQFESFSVVAKSKAGTYVSLLPTVSSDAGNLTRLGTDGYVYTSVSASDVTGLGTLATKSTLAASDITGLGPYATQPTISTTDVNGLGTIALKNTGDYLPITGGTLTGPVAVEGVGDISPLTLKSTRFTTSLRADVNVASISLLNTAPVVGNSVPWVMGTSNAGTLEIDSGTTPAITLNSSQVAANALGDRVTVNWPAYFDRTVNVLNTAGNTSSLRIDGPSSNGCSIVANANKTGTPSVALTGSVSGNTNTYSVSVQGGLTLNLGHGSDVSAIVMQRFTSATDSQVRVGWPLYINNGVTGGIDFNNTSNSPDRLDYYEEGNWTPAYAGDDPITATYANANGQYTRIGRMVHCTGYLQTSAVAFRSTGNLRITGLPFPRQLGTGATGAVGIANAWATEVPAGLCNDPLLTNAALLYDVKHSLEGKPGQPIVDVSSLTANSLLQFSFTYFTNT